MTVFFLCIVLIGIIITGVSLVMILADKSRSHDYRLELGQKRETLVETIEDAETLVDELNRFSDYVVTQCEQKKTEMEQEVRRAESLMDQLAAASDVLESKMHQNAFHTLHASGPDTLSFEPSDVGLEEESVAVGGSQVGSMGPVHVPGTVRTIRKPMLVKANPDLGETSSEQPSDASAKVGMPVLREGSRERGKVVNLDARRKEALSLAGKGMTHEEIARALNMGKGEIELIARIGSGS